MVTPPEAILPVSQAAGTAGGHELARSPAAIHLEILRDRRPTDRQSRGLSCRLLEEDWEPVV